MRKNLKSGFVGALCAGIAVIALPIEGSAGPAGVSAPGLAGVASQVEQIRYRRGPPVAYYPRRHYNVDVNAAISGGLAVAGAAVATHGYYYGYPYPYPYPYGYPAYYPGWGW